MLWYCAQHMGIEVYLSSYIVNSRKNTMRKSLDLHNDLSHINVPLVYNPIKLITLA